MATSKITNYDSADPAVTVNYNKPSDAAKIIDTQDINYLNYDRYGNAWNQNILTTSEEIDGTKTYIYKTIANTYDNKIAQMKGNSKTSETIKYSGTAVIETNLIEKTVTTTDKYDLKGNAEDQTTETSVYNSSHEPILQKVVTVHNENIDARGDAHMQYITTSETDKDGLNPEVTSYQVIENRAFDLSHNVKNQKIVTYTDAAKTELKDVQEIRSACFTSSGTAIEQSIATYSALTMTASDFIEAKYIFNETVGSQGNVGKSTITTYSAATLESGNGNIVLSDVSAVTKQTIITTRFDLRGNSTSPKRPTSKEPIK
ncbi:MAG: hypothetical protein NTY76_05715 [Candidatus Omnitrophica bacterium]|nr:hypothetical protein [Candidatus Omnitrophota bacterium]